MTIRDRFTWMLQGWALASVMTAFMFALFGWDGLVASVGFYVATVFVVFILEPFLSTFFGAK